MHNPDDWLECVQNNPEHPVVALHHAYQFFEDYGAVIPERLATWRRLAAAVISIHKDAVTTFAKVAMP